jgi:Ca-activated chloride channel family protein
MRFAASITGFGLLMKQSEFKGTITKQMVLSLGESAITFDPNGYRKEFIGLVKNWNE